MKSACANNNTVVRPLHGKCFQIRRLDSCLLELPVRSAINWTIKSFWATPPSTTSFSIFIISWYRVLHKGQDLQIILFLFFTALSVYTFFHMSRFIDILRGYFPNFFNKWNWVVNSHALHIYRGGGVYTYRKGLFHIICSPYSWILPGRNLPTASE